MHTFNSADSQNRAEQILRLGTIEEIDNKNRRVKIRSAELLSGWVPWIGRIGNNYKAWTPPRKGTQVLTASPSGDFSQAIIVQVIYTDNLNSPSTDEDVDIIEFNDGTVIKKDSSSITIDTPCQIDITAPNATLNADTTINGTLEINGNRLTHNGKDCGDTHTHGGISTGPSSTGVPN